MSHTGRPQEVFEQAICEGKPKIVAFELVWDTEISMEKVSKVLKAVPGNIQSQGFMEIASLVVCNSSYYSCIAKVQENWRNFEKFAEKEPMPWVKIAWMMVAGIKYPNLVLFQRTEGYKSSANFITSLDFENLVRFAKKQDERATIRPRNSERISISEGKSQKNPVGVQGSSWNPVEKHNPLPKSRLEQQEAYSRPENVFNNPNIRIPSSLDQIPLSDFSRKSQTPISRMYEFGEKKPGTINRVPQGEKHLLSHQDLDFNSNVDPSQRLVRPDMAKEMPRKCDRGVENMNFATRNSPKAAEDSFRSWDRNEDMERPSLFSPKDRERPFRTFSKQEEIQPKLPFTPQKLYQRELDRLPNYSPKEVDKVQSSSLYFNGKAPYRDRYTDLLSKDPMPSEDRSPGYGQRDELKKHREISVDHPRENYESEYRAEIKPMYSKEKTDALAYEYEDLSMEREKLQSRKHPRENYESDYRAEIKPMYSKEKTDALAYEYEDLSMEYEKSRSRNYKPNKEDSEQEEPPKGYRPRYFDDPAKAQNPAVENQMEGFKFLGARDLGAPREIKEGHRYRDNKVLEEFYQNDRNRKTKDIGVEKKDSEGMRSREYNFTAEEYPREGLKTKAFSYETMEKEGYEPRNFDYEEKEVFKSRNYRNGENDFKGELNAQDLNIDAPDMDKEERYPKYEREQLSLREFKFRDFTQEESLENPEILSKKYQSPINKELYDKYKLPTSQKSKEDFSTNKTQNPVYRQEEDYSSKYDYLRNKPEEHAPNSRDAKRREERLEGYNSIENSYEREIQSKDQSSPKDSAPYKPMKEDSAPYRPMKEESAPYRPMKEESRIERSSESTEFSDWSCSKCNKKVQGSFYECGECRLINWDQFYKVKSLQNTKIRSEENSRPGIEGSVNDDPARRLYSFSNIKEEHTEWMCAGCSTPNKSIFFLCKACKKPRAQGRAVEASEPVRKEYRFNS